MLIIFLSVLVLISWEMTLISSLVLILASLIPRVWIQQSAKTGREAVARNLKLLQSKIQHQCHITELDHQKKGEFK